MLPDASSPAAMAEAKAIGKGRRLHVSKADLMKHGLKDTLEDAVYNSKPKSPRRKMEEHA